MKSKVIYILFLIIFFSCSSKKNIKTPESKLVAFIKNPGVDSMSKSDFEVEKIIQLNSSKFKIRYATAYLHGEGFQSVQSISLTGNSLNNITHIYTFIKAKPPFSITFGDIKCSYYKGKIKDLIYAEDFTVKIY
ncbi:MAG: hypothetical protein JWN83_1211 [Chitinophagaceae bacterium]|nr:hypothetical protein [Chitinophagaceae bacterium]